jgi:hypothetical protein
MHSDCNTRRSPTCAYGARHDALTQEHAHSLGGMATNNNGTVHRTRLVHTHTRGCDGNEEEEAHGQGSTHQQGWGTPPARLQHGTCRAGPPRGFGRHCSRSSAKQSARKARNHAPPPCHTVASQTHTHKHKHTRSHGEAMATPHTPNRELPHSRADAMSRSPRLERSGKSVRCQHTLACCCT